MSSVSPVRLVCVFSAASMLALSVVGADPDTAARPLEAVIVEAAGVDDAKVAGWKKEGFRAVVLILEERSGNQALQKAVQAVTAHGLDWYYWIEVGRNPTLARAHPEWMASLGQHHDWQRRFPKVRPLEKGEVAKAWPWVPLRYRETFEAHRARIRQLLAGAPDGYRGLLLNDLQGGPASCGCGNLQCRWAIDYGVPSTATPLPAPETAARFVAEVRQSAQGKEVIPVWTIECESEDLPAAKRAPGSWGTGYCGGVPCFETCRKKFAEQWTALTTIPDGPSGLLLLHREFQRDRKEYGGPAAWITHAAAYVDKQSPRPLPHRRLWLVVQGYDIAPAEEMVARRSAQQFGAGAVLVARSRIDQSYEPRIIQVKTRP